MNSGRMPFIKLNERRRVEKKNRGEEKNHKKTFHCLLRNYPISLSEEVAEKESKVRGIIKQLIPMANGFNSVTREMREKRKSAEDNSVNKRDLIRHFRLILLSSTSEPERRDNDFREFFLVTLLLALTSNSIN